MPNVGRIIRLIPHVERDVGTSANEIIFLYRSRSIHIDVSSKRNINNKLSICIRHSSPKWAVVVRAYEIALHCGCWCEPNSMQQYVLVCVNTDRGWQHRWM